MRVALAILAAVALAACSRPAPAQSRPAHAVTMALMHPTSSTPIAVRSASIGPDGRIAARNSAYGANRSLPVTWTGVTDAGSYALVIEDPDAPGPDPFVHWLMWNIPPAVTQLAEETGPPAGAAQGRNGQGSIGYYGPHPPSGTHHYHVQVFALDRTLALAAGADRDALAEAMRGHVIAAGEIVGTSSAP